MLLRTPCHRTPSVMEVLFRLFSSSMSQDRKTLYLWNPHLFLMSRPER